MTTIVSTTRVYSKDIVTDWIQNIRNILGTRLIGYEKMINRGVEETKREFHKEHGYDIDNIKQNKQQSQQRKRS